MTNRALLPVVLGFALCLAVAAWGPAATPTAAQPIVYSVDDATAGSLIINVRPLDAEVRLDGHAVGTGRDVTARPMYVKPGIHVLEFSAPGFLPTAVQVRVRPAWGSQLWMDLVPDRRS